MLPAKEMIAGRLALLLAKILETETILSRKTIAQRVEKKMVLFIRISPKARGQEPG
jgi:hypothetical protein